MALLVGGFPPVSHLLLQLGSAGSLLPELIEMTINQPGGISLVVLGDPDRLPSHSSAEAMTFVPAPTKGWLHRLLALPTAGKDLPERLGEPELREALRSCIIGTRYQPIVRMADGYPIGLEVLARLEHPKLGVLQPNRFVPQIEEAGLAWPLTEAVIVRTFADWSEGKLGSFGLAIALNFPLDVLLMPEALASLETHRRRVGLPAGQLVVELTESRPVAELARLRYAVSTLRGLGYGVAIDDVGPELRDHRALFDLPFTILKLDRGLVRKSATLPMANLFLAQTIAAARAANLDIVAEGVEDKTVWNRMQGLGVDCAQGFLVARPLPASAVPLWYTDWRAKLAVQT